MEAQQLEATPSHTNDIAYSLLRIGAIKVLTILDPQERIAKRERMQDRVVEDYATDKITEKQRDALQLLLSEV